jgi:hypothetical protein
MARSLDIKSQKKYSGDYDSGSIACKSENATAHSFKQGFIWVDCLWEKLGLKSFIFQAFSTISSAVNLFSGLKM